MPFALLVVHDQVDIYGTLRISPSGHSALTLRIFFWVCAAYSTSTQDVAAVTCAYAKAVDVSITELDESVVVSALCASLTLPPLYSLSLTTFILLHLSPSPTFVYCKFLPFLYTFLAQLSLRHHGVYPYP